MGREVRRVPAGWEHPKTTRYNRATGVEEESFRPMHDGGFEKRLSGWLEEWENWKRSGYAEACKKYPEYIGMGVTAAMSECHGGPPDPAYFAPDWPESERTHYQLYETVSEGTPLSPPMPTLEDLARYLAANGDYWNQRRPGRDPSRSYEQWMAFLKVGWAPSMVMSDEHGMEDGVSHIARTEPAT
jgi:hypothetical protein